ncbi:MAG: hypothetical protein K5764_09470 [Prevotella sp.]|nr:hypothetical protein [Prevotella sp.]
MATIEEELELDEQENLREAAYIRQHLPMDMKSYISDRELLWMIDAIVDYYYDSGILESPEEEIEIDMEKVADYLVREAKVQGVGSFIPEDVLLVVQADLDYQEANA